MKYYFARLPKAEVLGRLAKVQLKGHEQAYVYANADLSVAQVDPRTLCPPQSYVLKPTIRKIIELHSYFKGGSRGIDIFTLQGGLVFTPNPKHELCMRKDTSNSADPDLRHLLPPIVEMSQEVHRKGLVPIIADGMHRVAAAMELGKRSINVILVSGVSHPYYAHAKPATEWGEVQHLEELPDNFEKKSYRVEKGYKDLFRKYGDLFPGIQPSRKKSNPSNLEA